MHKRLMAWTILGLSFMLVSTGCSREYNAEKEFFKAKKVLESVKLSAPVEELDAPIEAFQNVVDKFPATPKALESLIAISNLRLKQKKYEDARNALKRIAEDFSSNKDTVAEARDRIAQIYQAEGNWASAEKAYWDLSEFSALTARGLYAPIQIMLQYKRVKDEKGFEQAFVRALDHYEGLIKQLGPIDTAAPVKNYLAMTWMIRGDQVKAIELWEKLFKEHHDNGYAPLALLAAAELSWKHDNPVEAERFWQLYFREYPKHNLAGKSAVTVGMLYQGKKEYTAALSWYDRALQTYYAENSSERAEVKLLKAKVLQDSGDWAAAEVLYKEIEAEQPNTPVALQIPLLRAAHYKEAGNSEAFESVLSDAISLYESLETTTPGTDPMSAFATRFKTAAYAQKGDWQEMVSEVDRQRAAETDPEKKGRWLFLKALLIENRLKDPVMAKTLYTEFLDKYPSHQLSDRARAQLAALEKAS